MKHAEIGLNHEQIHGGIFGLLIGDAVGVPYEFKAAGDLPRLDEIDMVPPRYFPRTYQGIPEGTWSDDGSQALCQRGSRRTA